jgi:hypothetical protein
VINTFSKFNYGIQISTSNNKLDFDVGGGELTAELESGDYTLGEFAAAIETAFNAVTAYGFTVTLDRTTGRITIAATGGNYSLLLATGTNIGVSFAELAGFTQSTDLTGDDTYTGADISGSQYYPQFLLQSYVDPEAYKQSADATVNKAANGRVEVVRFGIERFIEMDIRFITNLPMDNVVIKNNPSGLNDAIDFLSDISQKYRFEFVPDVDDPDNYFKVILESYPGFENGTGFKLKELFGQNLPNIYETGVMRLRVVA